jgi:lipopolysaccharide/colanic/teichoic acid biosynthesis glycosyltransferase
MYAKNIFPESNGVKWMQLVEKFKLDVEYINKVSFLLDMKICG